MDFANILKAFPEALQVELLENLDGISISHEATRDEFLAAAQDAVRLTKLGAAYSAIQDAEKRKLVDTLLTFVPHAGATALFS